MTDDAELKLNLDICIGQISLGLNDLAEISAGEIFEFAWPKDHLLSIQVGEELVATGKLIREGENFFVEIIALGSETTDSGKSATILQN